jgi:hypothetical protein
MQLKERNRMKITLREFSKHQTELPVIVHSIDMAGYQAAVTLNGRECLLVKENGKPLRHQSLMHMREALLAMPVASLRLRHQSAYDEMINQPERIGNNTLELSLSLDTYPYAKT